MSGPSSCSVWASVVRGAASVRRKTLDTTEVRAIEVGMIAAGKNTDSSHGDTQDLRGLNFKRVLTDHAIVYFRSCSFMAQQMRVSNIGEMRNTMEHCK